MSKGVPQFFAAAAKMERAVPSFVERELNGYLDCGRYERGFAQVKCQACGHTQLVGFSCKGRGVCPSCAGRRMADLSCHLVDRVLPDVPYRQFVLSFPPPLRFVLAYDSALLSKALDCFIRSVSHWQRHEAKKRYGLSSVAEAITAAVTVVQRFGSAINLHPHLHSLFADGVWVRRDGKLVFVKLGRPSADELHDMGWRTARRLVEHLRRVGRWNDEATSDDGAVETEQFCESEPLLAEVYGASIRGRLSLGPGRGERVMVLRRNPNLSLPKDLAAKLSHAGPRGYTFDVHAAVSVQRADRKGLERMCRYLCRPAAGNERFEERPDGKINLRLKTPWTDGTTHVVLTPLQLVERMVALIPPPRVNMIRYHGAFAPNASARAQVVASASAADTAATSPEGTRCTHAGRQAYALLLKRVFAADVEQCAKCGERQTKIRFVTARDEIDQVLRSIGYPNAPDLDRGAADAAA
jgi:hypothetical protein